MNNMTQIGQQLRSTNRPIYGASTITVNNTIYIYGGFYNVYPWNKEALWTLSNSIDNLHQIDTDPFASPAVIYHSLLSIDNQTMYSFGGHLTNKDILNPPSNNVSESIRYYKFNFDQLSWKPLQKKNVSISAPLERFWHTTTKFDQTIYLYGGINITGNGFLDFWKYNAQLDEWIELNKLKSARCGHTSTMTDDGKMIILGGFDCTNSYFLFPKDKLLYPLSNALVFNSKSTQWYNQSLSGTIIPKARTFHTAIKSNNASIIICGGQDDKMEPLQTYISGNEMTAILDLNTWEWNIPLYSLLNQPFPSSFSISTLVNDTKMVYGLGLNSHSVYDGFYIFDIERLNWIPPSIITKDIKTNQTTTTTIIPLIIGLLSGAILLILVIYWILCKYGIILYTSIKKNIWNRRKGEPLWAEISRFLFRFLFLSIFIIINVVLILQVKNSPIIQQSYKETTYDMMVSPNIRICFDGWVNETKPILQCITDFGQNCDEHLIDITDKINDNLDYFGTELKCLLFIGGNELKLGENRKTSNGSLIQFYYYGKPTIENSIIHIELYHPFHDPNMPVYNITSSSMNQQFDGWYNEDEFSTFVSNEKLNLKSKNIYTIEPTKQIQIGYELKRIEKINEETIVWNYIGLKSKRNILNEIDTIKHETDQTIIEESSFLGSLIIFPLNEDILVMREQRAFTIIHAIGILGGILGLMIGFQTNLFGYRPQSPWGIVHRCSINFTRNYLLNGLKSRFSSSNQLHIPIVQPIYYPKENDQEKLLRLEERLNLFEFLFRAYYINDEIFQKRQN